MSVDSAASATFADLLHVLEATVSRGGDLRATLRACATPQILQRMSPVAHLAVLDVLRRGNVPIPAGQTPQTALMLLAHPGTDRRATIDTPVPAPPSSGQDSPLSPRPPRMVDTTSLVTTRRESATSIAQQQPADPFDDLPNVAQAQAALGLGSPTGSQQPEDDQNVGVQAYVEAMRPLPAAAYATPAPGPFTNQDVRGLGRRLRFIDSETHSRLSMGAPPTSGGVPFVTAQTQAIRDGATHVPFRVLNRPQPMQRTPPPINVASPLAPSLESAAPPTGASHPRPWREAGDASRNTQNLVKFFSNAKRQYSGTKGDGASLATAFRDYAYTARSFHVPLRDSLAVLHVLFSGSALEHYHHACLDSCPSLEEVHKEMRAHFETVGDQDNAHADWDQRTSSQFVRLTPGNPFKALEAVWDSGVRLQNLLGDAYGGDEHLRDYLLRVCRLEKFASLVPHPRHLSPRELYSAYMGAIRKVQQGTVNSVAPLVQHRPRAQPAYFAGDASDWGATADRYIEEAHAALGNAPPVDVVHYVTKRVLGRPPRQPGEKNSIDSTTGKPRTCHDCGSEYHFRRSAECKGPPLDAVQPSPSPTLPQRRPNDVPTHARAAAAATTARADSMAAVRDAVHLAENEEPQTAFYGFDFDDGALGHGWDEDPEVVPLGAKDVLWQHCRTDPGAGSSTDHAREEEEIADPRVWDPGVIREGVSTMFLGFCVDTGCYSDIIGLKQFHALLRRQQVSGKPTLKPSSRRFSFGSSLFRTLGVYQTEVPLDDGYALGISLHVITNDCPCLVGLQSLLQWGATLSFYHMRMQLPQGPYGCALIERMSHIFLDTQVTPTWSLSQVLAIHKQHGMTSTVLLAEDEFTEDELNKLHAHFGHQSAAQLLRFLRKARPNKVRPGTHRVLASITEKCATCRQYGPPPRRTRVVLPAPIVFGHEVAMDVFHEDGDRILHVICRGTRFNAAAILDDMSTRTQWETFLRCWVYPYLGFPHTLIVDAGKEVTARSFQAACAAMGVSLVIAPTEGHATLGVGEQRHGIVRNTYRRLALDFHDAPKHLRLAAAVYCVNAVAGVNGHSPTMLAFGHVPRLHIGRLNHRDYPTQARRMEIMLAARRCAEEYVAEARLAEADRRNLASDDSTLSEGDLVEAHREQPGRKPGVWVGPLVFMERSGNQTLVLDGHRQKALLSSCVRRYRGKRGLRAGDENADGTAAVAAGLESTLASGARTDAPAAVEAALEATTGPAELPSAWEETALSAEDASSGSDEESQPSTGARILRSGTTYLGVEQPGATKVYSVEENDALSSANDNYARSFGPTPNNKTLDHQDVLWADRCTMEPDKVHHAFDDAVTEELEKRLRKTVYLSEVISREDPRSQSPQMDAARDAEVKGLFRRGAFELVPDTSVPKNANILNSRFVLVIKNTDGQIVYKARLVIMGHTDTEKSRIIPEAPTLAAISMRIIFTVTTLMGWLLYTRDVKQAFLQSGSKLSRNVFVRPPKELRQRFAHMLLRMILPLYGLIEAGSYWFSTYLASWMKHLNMQSAFLDPCLLHRRRQDKLDGICGLLVDDSLIGGTATFQKKEAEMHKQFDMSPARLSQTAFTFAGLYIVQTPRQGLRVNQTEYIAALKPYDVSSPSLTAVRAGRGKLGWITTSYRLDYAYRVGQLAQVTQDRVSKAIMVEVNKIICGLQSTKHWSLPYLPLDLPSAQLVVYGDASFATNHDSTSQAGCVIVLRDKNGRAHVLHWHSRKIARVATSVLTAEVLAFVTAFDIAYAIRETLAELLGRSVDLVMLTDSHSLFSTVLSYNATKEKRLMIDISYIRQSYKRYEITNVGFVRTAHMLADPLTKDAPNAALNELIQTGCIPDLHIEKFVSRSDGLDAGTVPVAEPSAPVDLSVLFSEVC